VSAVSRVSGLLGRRTATRVSASSSKPSKPRHECGGGLCKACGWAEKRVPEAWLEQGPGTPYPGRSKLLGQKVTLKAGEPPSTIVSTATPLGETIFQQGRSLRYKCQGAFIVRTPFGSGAIETPVPKSVVRERMRAPKREGNCEDQPVYRGSEMKGFSSSVEREALKAGRHPYDQVGELPFPHRKGSTPCCNNSTLNPASLDRLIAAWVDSGEEVDFEKARAAVVRALPKHLRATARIETRADLFTAVRAVRDHCWSQWVEYEARHTEPSKAFQKRIKANRKAMVSAGLPVTESLARRRLMASGDVKAETGEERDARVAREGQRPTSMEDILRGFLSSAEVFGDE